MSNLSFREGRRCRGLGVPTLPGDLATNDSVPERRIRSSSHCISARSRLTGPSDLRLHVIVAALTLKPAQLTPLIPYINFDQRCGQPPSSLNPRVQALQALSR